MLGYKVELKSEEEIKELCYETENGGLGQDSIAFDYDTLVSYKFYQPNVKVVEVTNYDEDMYAYMIENSYGGRIYVHLDWFNKIDGYKVCRHKVMSSSMTKVTSKAVINPKTGVVTKLTDLPMCECGEVGTTTFSNGTHICNTCLDEATKVNGYSYRPKYKFIGNQIKGDEETPTWYGIEIEMSTNKGKLAEYMGKYKNSVYLKSDSSIKGSGYKVEMVSMPHSFNALMANDSWLSNVDRLPTNGSDSNGTHVHISRTAFKDDKHYSLFYFLLHKMERIAIKVGGRELTDYCKLAPTGKVHKKGNKKDNGNRTVFLNETNDTTVEARFFKGTTNTTNLKAYVQFLESMIKYTKYHSKTVTSKGWFGYITKKSNKYSELLKVLDGLDVSTLTEGVTYREPTLVHIELSKLLVTDFSNIVEIHLKDDRVFKDIEITSIRGNVIEFYFNSRDDHKGAYLRDIDKLVVEKE